jgi:hypothetical protein
LKELAIGSAAHLGSQLHQTTHHQGLDLEIAAGPDH